MGVERLRSELRIEFERVGLLPFILEDSTQVLDLGDELFTEIVLSDAAKREQAKEVLGHVLRREAGGRKTSFLVRSKWVIEQVGELMPAYGQDGGLRAAVLIPVRLKSGSERTLVTVAVTKMAEWELDRSLGTARDAKLRLQRVAELVVEGKLLRGGRSSWDPITESYLEVASAAVANISRLMKQSA